eukprot:scaffold66846_cov72-Phaeocystis_antarctica.AAC.1
MEQEVGSAVSAVCYLLRLRLSKHLTAGSGKVSAVEIADSRIGGRQTKDYTKDRRGTLALDNHLDLVYHQLIYSRIELPPRHPSNTIICYDGAVKCTTTAKSKELRATKSAQGHSIRRTTKADPRARTNFTTLLGPWRTVAYAFSSQTRRNELVRWATTPGTNYEQLGRQASLLYLSDELGTCVIATSP